MALFQNIAEVVASLTPRRPRHAQSDDQQQTDAHSIHQHSHSSLAPHHSSQVRASRPSRRVRHSWNQYSLGSESDDADLSSPHLSPNRDPAARLQSAQSYDNDLYQPPGTANTHGRLRPPSSQLVSELSARPSGSGSLQMLGRDQKRTDAQARQEEARLLGARDYRHKDAVPITPGASLGRRKTPGSFGAFKPTDRISRNSRESGPVRASGNSNPSASHFKGNYLQMDDPLDFEESSRPNKRRRQDVSNKRADSMEEESTKSGSSAGARSAAKQKHSDWGAFQLGEFRSVEDSIRIDRSPRQTRRSRHDSFASADSHDEQFTATAAQQRRCLPNTKERPRHEVLGAIEIPTSKDISTRKTSGQSRSDRQKGTLETGARRDSEGRESPDELQGDATTQPVPKFLNEKHEPARRKFNENMISPGRKRSPSDIQPTEFASSSYQGSKRAKRNHRKLGVSILSVLFVGYGPVNKRIAKGESAAIRLSQDKLELGEDITGSDKKIEIPLRLVRMVQQGTESSRRVRLILSRHSEAQDANNMDIEFLMALDKGKLVSVLQDMQTKVQNKEDSYMEKAFANSEREWAQHGIHTKRPLLDTPATEPTLPSSAPVTRRNISSALQDSAGEPSEDQPSRSKSGIQGKTDGTEERGDVARERKEASDGGVEIPVRPFRPAMAEQEGRTTRRTTRLSGKSIAQDDDVFDFGRRRSPQKDVGREKWKKPLVYPRVGKKKAEVSVEDRDRLREGEFLNDNLIEFYMRFLQEHLERTNKPAAQRVYFFNSYFFDTLTKTPKGERGINYSGVEKWTRNVDLFSYDYVVVPINQAAHWYVAIICNLPSLELGSADSVEPSSAAVSDKETSNPPGGEVQEIPESPEPEPVPNPSAPVEVDSKEEPKRDTESPTSQGARRSLASMSLDENEQAQDEGAKQGSASTAQRADGDENPGSTPANTPTLRQRAPETQRVSAAVSQESRKVKKKKGKAGPKLKPGQTTIITFDSLDLSRSPTITMLREYICKEAESKRKVEVDPAAIKGMRARQIPLQPNYSDCGLYLLAYVEKFVQVPDQFIVKLLQREMDEKDDWPPLGSGLLRHRLRNFLDDLYEEQTQPKKEKVEAKPSMADQQPVCFLLGPPLPSQDDGDDGKKVQEPSEPAEPTEHSKGIDADEKPALEENTAQSKQNQGSNDGSTADQPQLVALETDSTSKSGKKAASEPPQATNATGHDPAPSTDEEQEVIEVPDSQEKEQAKTPRSQPESKPSRNEDPASKTGEARSKRSQRRKATIPADAHIVNVDGSTPKEVAKGSEPEATVQVRQTPPPSEPKRVRKSP